MVSSFAARGNGARYPPDQARMEDGRMTDGDFTRFLVERGLEAAGSGETIDGLGRRFGVRSWFGFSDVIELPPASLFPEQAEPFFIRTERSCLLPPSEFECDFDYHRDAFLTYHRALDRLTGLFGEGSKGAAVNTLSNTWTFERISLTIRTFLQEKTTGRNPLYAKYPELWNFCRISIDRNWVRPLSQPEAESLNSLNSADTLPVDYFDLAHLRRLSMWERGLFRLAGDGAALYQRASSFLWKHKNDFGWCAGPWSGIFPRDRSMKLRLDRAEAARSAGYSRLSLHTERPFQRGTGAGHYDRVERQWPTHARRCREGRFPVLGTAFGHRTIRQRLAECFGNTPPPGRGDSDSGHYNKSWI